MDFGILTLFAAGLGTFFTPCVLPLIPIYLAILLGAKRSNAGRFAAIGPALSFIVGFSLVFTILGLGASFLGVALVKYKVLFSIIAGFFILIFGLKFLGVISIPILDRDTRYQGSVDKTRFQSVNAFLMGFFFAFGWTPCVGPILGSVLTWTAVNADSPIQGALYLTIFSSGFAVPMLLAAVFTTQAQALFDKIKPRLPVIEKALGAILIFVAATVLMDATSPLMKQAEPEPVLDEVVISEPIKNEIPEVVPVTAAGPKLVEFYSPNCPSCKKVAPAVERIKESCEGKGVQIAQLNVKEVENLKQALELKVIGVPAFVFFDSQGKEVAGLRLMGNQSEDKIREHLAGLIGHQCPDDSEQIKGG